MKTPLFLCLLLFLPLLSSCGPGAASAGDGYTPWTPGDYTPLVPHAPRPDGWKRVTSTAVKFREYEIRHPEGRWIFTCERSEDTIQIITHSGKTHRIDYEWYPEEGGADAAVPYVFVKNRGAETLIIFQGTGSITYEETHFRFNGEDLADLRRYASKGPGMGSDAPGKEPRFKEYPPRSR